METSAQRIEVGLSYHTQSLPHLISSRQQILAFRLMPRTNVNIVVAAVSNFMPFHFDSLKSNRTQHSCTMNSSAFIFNRIQALTNVEDVEGKERENHLNKTQKNERKMCISQKLLQIQRKKGRVRGRCQYFLFTSLLYTLASSYSANIPGDVYIGVDLNDISIRYFWWAIFITPNLASRQFA